MGIDLGVDVAQATHDLLAGPPEAALGRLAQGCPVRRNGKSAGAWEALEELCGTEAECIPKRNLCLVRWRRGPAEGAAIVAWDQQGKVVALDLYG